MHYVRFALNSAAAAGLIAAITLGGQSAASAAAVPNASDGGSGHWTQVTGQTAGSAVIGLVRGADGILHVIWQEGNHGQKIMDTPIAPNGAVGKQTAIATESGFASNPDATATPQGLDASTSGSNRTTRRRSAASTTRAWRRTA